MRIRRPLSGTGSSIEPDRHRYQELIRKSLTRGSGEAPCARPLRLACYYAQDLTLAQTGRLLGEHESTMSRQSAGTRRAIRETVERELRIEGLTGGADCRMFCECDRDAGPLDVRDMLGAASGHVADGAQGIAL